MTQVLTFRPPEVVAFDHKFFGTFEDAYFRLDSNDALPVFTFELGQQTVALPFGGIKREFAIQEYASDGVMLNTVARSLHFVSILRPGDPVPPEVLTGDASSEPGSSHQEAARRALSGRLVAWNLGQDAPTGDPALFERYVREHVKDEAVRSALLRMSVELGHGAGGGKIVSDLLDEASDEFAYIEFLRERFFAVRSVSERVRRIRRELAHHASMIAEIDPVLRLIAVPLRSLGEKITDADDHAADVVSLFGGFEMHQKAVRIIRDDLHRRLRPWDEIVEAWRYVSDRSVDPYATIPLLRDLYRFLAPRYMPADTWALMLAAEAGRENRQGIGNVVTWYERQSEPA